MDKNLNNVINEICQLANITITKAGEGQSFNPAELVALSHILDRWKDTLLHLDK